MSSVFKLAIKGIRLFSPEEDETIQFGFPLTLICGQNGTGKTTIIECLKYATTGFLPPNSKGGAFVNDPVLSGRNNVTGQVKLAFQNANGKSMLLTRTVQLSRKKGRTGGFTNTFKTLEGQLAIIENKEKTSISSKNAELDSQTPIYLGASPAILEYVIFCHQEDALWPLSEASVLKKRFDDIFEASKFTKVIDNLKVIKKDMMVDIKLIEQSVGHLLTDKARASKIKERVINSNSQMEKLTAEITTVNIQIEKLEQEAEQLFASNQEFQKTLSDFDKYNYNKKSLQEQIERLENNIEILADSDEDLLHQQSNFAAIVAQKNTKRDELVELNDAMSLEISKLQKTLDDLIGQEAVLKARKTTYEENVNKLNDLITENATNLNFSIEGEISENYDRFKPVCLAFLNKAQESYDKIVASSREKELDSSKLLQEAIDRQNRESQHQLYIAKDLVSSKDQKAILEKKLKLADVGSELDEKKEELASLVEKWNEKKSLDEIKELDTKVDKSKSAILQLEAEVEEISKKVAVSSKQSEVQTKITLLQESIATKQKVLDRITSANKDSFVKFVDSDFDSTCESKLNEKISTLSVDLNNLEESFTEASANANSLKADLESIDKTIRTNLQASKKAMTTILTAVDEEEIPQYESTLADLEESYANVMEDVNTSAATREFNSKAIDIAERDHNCVLCKRSFDTPSLSKFILALKISINVDAIKQTEQTALEIKKDLDSVKAIMNDVLIYRSSIEAIDMSKKNHMELTEKYEKLQQDVNDKRSQIAKDKNSLQSLNDLRRPLGDITRLNLEIFDLQITIDDLSEELNDFGTISLSLTELQKLQNQKNIEIKGLRQQVSDDSDAKYAIQREISRLENKVKDFKLAISNMEKTLADVNNIKNSLKEVSSKIEELEEQNKESIEHIKVLETERAAKLEILENIQRENMAINDEAKEDLKIGESINDSFQKLYNSVRRFENEDMLLIEENYVQVKEAMESRESKNSKISDNLKIIRRLEKENADASKIEQNIIYNIDYRGLQHQLEQVDEKIRDLDMTNAHVRKEEYQQKSRKLREQISELNASHAGKIGEIKQIKDQISAMQKELDTDYKNIDRAYHEEWIKLQTNLLISNDIQTYSKALDNAIMKYHSMKMEEINKILHELWSQTYKGSDIETIAIKSDVNVQAKGNRSYNYRVVMYKTGNELDMRGRCSAGQKVLTSILIRLALAESFGINCGIIALDEPTTNLDQENTESLAEALNQIIEFRKTQANFQLIVITHDETFLTHINGGNFTDHFYRIQRDESQLSRIYRLPISKIR